MALYKDGNPVSGLNSIPRLTLAQYNALNVKPDIWVRTDAPESYKKLSADQVSYDSNNTVKDKIDSYATFNLVSVTPGTNVTNAFVFVLELANAYIISGGFTLTGNISQNDTIMSGISFNGGGTLMCSCPYSSSGIMTFLNGSIISNAGLNSNPNSYYFNGIVLK